MTSAPIDAALLPDTARVLDDDVEVGGVSLRALAAEHGTPLFVYDEATMRARAAEAARSFDPGAAYGSKAFLCGAVARLVVEEGLCDRRGHRGRARTWCCAPGSRRAGSSSTATTSRTPRSAPPSPRASTAWSWTTSTRSPGSRARCRPSPRWAAWFA